MSSGKGVDVPDLAADFPSMTQKDKAHLEFALRNGFDIIAVSFVRTAKNVEHVRRLIHSRGGNHMVVAKIEKR